MSDPFESDLDAFRDWWATGGRKTRRDSTALEYMRHVRNWHRWSREQPDGPLTTPTVRSVRAYVRHVRPRSEWTAVEAPRALKTYSKWMVIDQAVEHDPLAELEYLERPQTSRTPVAHLDAIDRLLESCAGSSLIDMRDRAIILVLRSTGMRRNELAQMRWEHVDLTECTVFVPNDSAKNGKCRLVGFDRDAREALRRYYRAVGRWDDETMGDRLEFGRVFVGRMGPLTSNGVGQAIQRRSAGVDVTAHSFRRSLAMRWLREGRSETLLMRTAGWTSPDMVRRYTHSVATRKRSSNSVRCWRPRRLSGAHSVVCGRSDPAAGAGHDDDSIHDPGSHDTVAGAVATGRAAWWPSLGAPNGHCTPAGRRGR